MKAFVITMVEDRYSLECAQRCIASARGVNVDVFEAVCRKTALSRMKRENLQWTWANMNRSVSRCPKTGLVQHPYRTADLRARMGCAMSHYALWQRCVQSNEPLLILEHDSVFIRELPVNIEFNGICMINDPKGATPRGAAWSKSMRDRGTVGVHEKTWVTNLDERSRPDGLAGNSAYLIRPFAAHELIKAYKNYGVWPNDATMCKQLFPYLEEYYPFITRVHSQTSTTST